MSTRDSLYKKLIDNAMSAHEISKSRAFANANARGFRSRAERNEVKRSVSAEILKFFK